MSSRSNEELLPWYANGTLDEDERRQVEAWLQDNPDARLQLAEYEFLQETVAEVSDQEPVLRENLFDELLEQIDTEEQQAANSGRRPVQTPSLMQRLSDWIRETLQWNMTPAFARVAVVSQFAVVMALGAVLLIPTADEGYEVLSGGDPAVVSEGVVADIAVKPDMTIGEFQALLRRHQAQILSGPGSLGIYRIQLTDSAGADEVLAAIKGDASVTYLQRVSP